MRQPILAFALGALAAVALASCGSGEDAKLLPGNTAAEISENLDRVRQFVDEGECIGAENAAQEIRAQVEGLNGVDEKLTQALRGGAERLDEVVATCEETETETETIPPASEAPSTEAEKEVPPGLEKKAEKEREKEEKALEKEAEKQEKEEEKEVPPVTPTPPAETPPAETPPSDEGGGTDASGGVGPGAPVGEGE